jgi:hypothetical protein
MKVIPHSVVLNPLADCRYYHQHLPHFYWQQQQHFIVFF